MKTDGLRGLTVTYSPVKLPNRIKVSSNTGTVDYIYDALGNKLAVKQGGTMKNVYCGDFVYDASLAVDYILTPNGQLTRNPSTGAYTAQYNITDHLGNVRSVVSSGNTVLQSTDYYPFGLAFSDANITNNRYLYNGKELEDYTIGTSYLGTLDYGARHYDSRIARWTVPDPMAEKYYSLSAYIYCANSPIITVDPYGADITIWGANGSSVVIFTQNYNVEIDRFRSFDLKGNYYFDGIESAVSFFDLTGIFDPTFVSDGISAVLSCYQGNIGSTLLSLAAMIPYLGDIPKLRHLDEYVEIYEVVRNKHHLIPKAIYKRMDELWDIMKQDDYLLEVPAGFHGNHPAYNEWITK